MSKPRLRFEYWKSLKNGQWYWRLKAGNNEPICQSEGYKTKRNALNLHQKHFHSIGGEPIDAVDINAESFAKFKNSLVTPKKLAERLDVIRASRKPAHYEGKLR